MGLPAPRRYKSDKWHHCQISEGYTPTIPPFPTLFISTFHSPTVLLVTSFSFATKRSVPLQNGMQELIRNSLTAFADSPSQVLSLLTQLLVS